MENFIKSHGIVKDELVKERDLFKIDHRFYSQDIDGGWILYQWNDEHTCVYSYGEIHYITLWYKGKIVMKKVYQPVTGGNFLSACFQLYSIQEGFIGTKYSPFAFCK